MDVADLYHGPLQDFVRRRTALSRELRSRDPGAAAAVGKLRKPSMTAWAIDQVAASEPGRVAELLVAGSDARGAQESLAEGAGSGEELRAASARVREALDAAASAAEAVMAASGHAAGDEAARRIRVTLQAAATGGAAVRLALWRGTLDRDVDPSGFGGPDGPEADPPEMAAVLEPLRRRPVANDRPNLRVVGRRPREHAEDRSADRGSAAREEAARLARATARVKRERANRLADEMRKAEAEATLAEQAAESAEDAAEHQR